MNIIFLEFILNYIIIFSLLSFHPKHLFVIDIVIVYIMVTIPLTIVQKIII